MTTDNDGEDQDELTLEGLWWLPTKPDRRLPGRLTFSPHTGGTLKVWDELCPCGFHSQSANCHETILGLTSAAQPISLYDCEAQGGGVSNRGNVRAVTTRYHTGFLLNGAHFKSLDEASFSSYTAEFPNLAAWLGDATASSDWAKDANGGVNELVVKWPVPANSTLYLTPQYKIKVYAQTGTDPDGPSAIRISQRRHLELEFQESSPIDAMWPILQRMKDFLSLGFGEPAYVKNLAALHMEPESKFPHPVDLHRWARDPRKVDDLSGFRMLFTLEELKAKAPQGFERWFAQDTKGIDALRPFFAALYNDELYVETKFTMLVNALESYHRRTGKNQVCSEEDHRERLGRILGVIQNDSDRAWLEARLSNSNQPALRARLTELTSRVTSVIERIELECKDFVARVADTRNYLVHHDSSGRAKAAKDEELIGLTHRVEAFCAALLLSELGFQGKELPHMLSRTSRYRGAVR